MAALRLQPGPSDSCRHRRQRDHPWDVDTRRERGEPFKSESARSLAFSSDGRLLVVAAPETVTIWELARHLAAEPLRAHSFSASDTVRVRDLALSPRGHILVTAEADKTLRLWDLARAAPLGEPLESQSVNSLAFSPNGNMFASAGRVGTFLWDPILVSDDLEAWRERLCGIALRNLSEGEWRSFLPNEPYHKTCAQIP
jgi:WD40 repeat protein